MIIGLNGYSRSGKDTVADIIRTIDPQFKRKAFADKLKEVCSVITGIPVENFHNQEFKDRHLHGYNCTIREFLQIVGTDGLRRIWPDIWVRALFDTFYSLTDKRSTKWVITDCRFPNEAEVVKSYGGIVVRVNRGLPANLHTSETALDHWKFDHVIDNNGTIEELHQKVLCLF